MTRRLTPPLNGARYCGNTNEMEVHDLDNEKSSCQIDKIIAGGHARPYHSVESAHTAGYDNCHWCLGGSTR